MSYAVFCVYLLLNHLRGKRNDTTNEILMDFIFMLVNQFTLRFARLVVCFSEYAVLFTWCGFMLNVLVKPFFLPIIDYLYTTFY